MKLVFYMDLNSSRFLLEGRLLLLDGQGLVDTFLATSGCAGHQRQDSQSAKGRGPIPSCLAIGLGQYQVATNPVNLPQIPGVAGAFYPISPAAVMIDGISRGDFGIHFDANVPGSAGCVVLRTPKGWEAFQQHMRRLQSQAIKQLPLIVSYAY